jgi:hypothetical protein
MRGYKRSNDVHFGCMTHGWKAFEVVWSSLQRFMIILVDIGQLKQLLFSIPFLI